MASRATAARSLVAAAAFAVAGLLVSDAGATPADSTGTAAAPRDSSAVPSQAAPPPAATPAPPPATPLATPLASSDWDTLSTGLPEQVVFGFTPMFAYDRVDGPFAALDVGFKRRKDDQPLIHAWFGYAVSRERGLGGAGFDVPFGYRGALRLAGDVYRKTASQDEWIVGGTENTFFALVARTDYRDWYEAKGGVASLRWNPGRDASLSISARLETQSSLRTRTRVSLLGSTDRFRPNPPIDEGDLGAWTIAGRIGPERIPPSGGTNGSIAVERAGDPIARDFRYTRIRAEARAQRQLTLRQSVRARLIGGSTRDGALPSQMIWSLGGIGTLRALDYKAFSGDQFFLANAEYYVRVRKNLYPMAFLDWGAAWFGRENLSRQRPALDGGVGLRLGEGPILLTVGRDLERSGAPWRVGIRLGGSF